MGDVVKQSIEIDAPIEEVWDLVMDPDRFGEWVTIHKASRRCRRVGSGRAAGSVRR